MKFIILFLLIVGVLFYFFRDRKKVKKEQEDMMLECRECGVFVSPKEGVIYKGHCYCSQECFKKGEEV